MPKHHLSEQDAILTELEGAMESALVWRQEDIKQLLELAVLELSDDEFYNESSFDSSSSYDTFSSPDSSLALTPMKTLDDLIAREIFGPDEFDELLELYT